MQAISKHPTRLILISLSLFSQLPRIIQNVGVSVGCLEGVWEVSGGCLSDSGHCLGGYGVKSFDKNSI